jgi:CRP-like cAMP-binding protein
MRIIYKRIIFYLQSVKIYLKKRPKMRSQMVNLILQIFLESSGLSEYLKKSNFDENNFKNLLANILNSCGYISVPENNILIQHKEKIEKYYILLTGKCKYYEQNKTQKQMTIKEYYHYLIKLQRKGEISNIKNNIEENNDKILIEYSDLDRINYLLFLKELKYNLYKCRTKQSDIMKIFNEFFMNLNQFGLDNEELIKFNNSQNFEGLSKYCKSILKDEFEFEEYKEDILKFKLNENSNEKLFFRICETLDLGEIPINSFISEEFLTQNSEQKEEIEINDEDDFEKEEKEFHNKMLTKNYKNKKLTNQEEIHYRSNQRSNLRKMSINTTLNMVVSDDDTKNKIENLKNTVKNNSTLENSLNLKKMNKLQDKKKPFINNLRENNENELSYCAINIISESDCSYLVISKDVFLEFFNQEKQKIKTREIVYLIDNFFFGSVNKKIFEKKYKEKFKLKTYSFDTVLFNEKEAPEKLFLIKEGIIEISLNKNLMELTSLIKDLIKLEPSLKNSIDNKSDFKANNQLKNIVDEISKKRKFIIFKYDAKDIVGMESIFLNHNYFYKATVISRKALIYEINLNSVKNLKRESQDVRDNFDDMSFEKLNSFIQRIIYLKNIYLRTFDNRVTEEQMKIKMDLNMKKNIEKISDINNNNGVNILSKEIISLDKYNEIKDMLLNKGGYSRRAGHEIPMNNQYAINNKMFNKFTNVLTEFNREEDYEIISPKKIIVVNNKLNSPDIENKVNPLEKSGENPFLKSKEIQKDKAIKHNYYEINKNSEENYKNKKEEKHKRKRNNLSMDSKASNFKTEKNKSPTGDKKITNETNDSSSKIRNEKRNFDKKTSLRNSKKNNESLIDSQNVSIGNIEAKKIDYDVLVFGEKETKEKNKKDVFRRQNSDNNIDLIKYYNNYKSLRKASNNFKMEEFFKEGIPLSTQAFEKGSFFVTSNNSEEKIKWRKVDKKVKKSNRKKLQLEEIDPFIDIDVPLNNIMLTSPVQTNESFDFVSPKSPFKLKRSDIPIIKKIKFEAEHKKNLENLFLKKNKKTKFIDDKILSIFQAVDDKRIKILNFENPNFLGENNDYLLPRNSLKSENIKEFYRMIHNKKIKGNKLKQQLLNNEG